MTKVAVYGAVGFLALGLVAACYAISGAVFMFAWNGFIVKLFTQLPVVDYGTAIAGSFALSILTGSFQQLVKTALNKEQTK